MRSVLPLVVVCLAIACAPAEEPDRRSPLDRTEDPKPTVPTTDEPTEPILPTLELEPVLVVINELMARNDSTYTLADGSRPDWVELVNIGDEPAPLSRLSLEDSAGNKWRGETGELAPGERILLDGNELDFALDSDEDTLTLKADTEVIDEVSWIKMERDISLARTPDMTGDLLRTAWATPGLPNEATTSATVDAATEHVFVTTTVHRIDFSMTTPALNTLDGNDERWAQAGMEFDGIAYDTIGIRLKGSASFDRMDGKPAFKVDMNKGVPGTRLKSLKGFNLHNGNVLDPTRVRDYISYRFAREAGIMAPRVGWAEVYVNDNYYGIYMVIEQHDDVMMDSYYPGTGAEGVMMEPNEDRDGGWGFGSDFGSGNTVSNWDYEEGAVPPNLDIMAALETADDIVSRAATDANVEELYTVVDKQALHTYMGWESIISHTDGYKAPNNWRVFIHPVDKKVHLVPAGAEWTWDNNPSPLSWGGRLASWCLENGQCKRDYAERTLEMVDLVDDLGLQAEFLEISIFLAPIIAMDPRSRHSANTVSNTRDSTYDNIYEYPRDVRSTLCGDIAGLDGCTAP